MTARQAAAMIVAGIVVYAALLVACSAFWLISAALFGGPLP